jgi:hypothetical protein
LEAEAFLAAMKGLKLADGRDRLVRHGPRPSCLRSLLCLSCGSPDGARVRRQAGARRGGGAVPV